MMDKKSKFKSVLRELYSREEGLYSFQLNSLYGLTPSESIELIDILTDKGMLLSDEKKLRLNNKARSEILFLFHDIDGMEDKDEMSYLNSVLTGKVWHPFDPYIPGKKYLYIIDDIF